MLNVRKIFKWIFKKWLMIKIQWDFSLELFLVMLDLSIQLLNNLNT